MTDEMKANYETLLDALTNEMQALHKELQECKEKLSQEPCEDVISRQAVLEAIDVKAWEFCDYLIRNGRNDEQKPVSHFADKLRECVGEDLPSVTPQPKMGRWEYIKKEDSYKCSLCGFPCHKDNLGAIPTNYCAGCGAVMEV